MIAPRNLSEALAEGLSEADWQEVSDFYRWLRGPGSAGPGQFVPDDRAYAWLWYAKGICGAPPLMWEGDDN